MGSLYWQINDCWPATSWATVDYYGRWKAAHYAVKKAFQALLVVPSLEQDNLRLDLASDYLDVKKLQAKAFSFPILEKGSTEPVATRNGNMEPLSRDTWVLEDIHDGNMQKGYYIEIRGQDDALLATNIVLPQRMKHYYLEKPVIKITREDGTDSIHLRLTADRFARGVKIQASTQGEYSDNYFDLVPGVEHEVVFNPGHGNNLGDIEFSLSSYADYIR
jgi:beta-mannosidase